MKVILISLSILISGAFAFADEPKKFQGAPDALDSNLHTPDRDQGHRTVEACNDPTGQCITTYGGGTRACSNIRPGMTGETLRRAREVCVAGILGTAGKPGAKPGETDGETK